MKLSLAFGLLTGATVWAADAVPMDVKTGQWETTVTTQMTGMQMPQGQAMPSIPPEQLAKMPPETRAKVEAAMKQAGAMASGKPTTFTSKNCIKKEDLAKMTPPSRDQTCKTTLVSSSRTRQELKMECDANGNKQTGTVVMEAVSSDSTKFTMQLTGMQDGKQMGMTMNGTGKWLGATCTDSK